MADAVRGDVLPYLFLLHGRQTFGFAFPASRPSSASPKEGARLGQRGAVVVLCGRPGHQRQISGDKFGGAPALMSAGAILSFIMNWATSLSTGIVKLLTAFWGINGYFQSMGWAPGSRLLSNWWGRHKRGTVTGSTLSRRVASVLSFVTSLVVVCYFQLDWRWIFRIRSVLLLLGRHRVLPDRAREAEDVGFASPHDEPADDRRQRSCYRRQ